MQKAKALFLALLRSSEIVVLGALVACTNGRVGTQVFPFGSVESDANILHAIKHSLLSAELSCPLDLLTPYEADHPNRYVVAVQLCGRSHHYLITYKSVDADSAMVVAKRLE
jgi:hypothetical protein